MQTNKLNTLGVSHTSEAGPSYVSAMGEVLNQVLGMGELPQEGGSANSRF